MDKRRKESPDQPPPAAYPAHYEQSATHYERGGHPPQTGYSARDPQSRVARGPPVISMQPVQQQPTTPSALRGLESLATVNELAYHKNNDIFFRQVYDVLNSSEQKLAEVHEEDVPSEGCCSMICIPNRAFRVHALDSYGQDMFVLDRNFKCCAGCACCADGCCYNPSYVSNRRGQKLGMVRWMETSCKPRFGIYGPDEELLYDLWSPATFCDVHVEFPISNVRDGRKVGNLSCLSRAGFIRGNRYDLTFDVDLDVEHKALMIASVFIIDVNLFEKQFIKR